MGRGLLRVSRDLPSNTGHDRRHSRWIRNFPVPRAHAVALAASLLVQVVCRRPLPVPRSARLAAAGVIGTGAGLAVWATCTASPTDLADPDRLVTMGPYRFSRNPMYVAWTLIYAGAGTASANPWSLALLPAVLMATHRTVTREERRLRDRFGLRYLAYTARVRRYL